MACRSCQERAAAIKSGIEAYRRGDTQTVKIETKKVVQSLRNDAGRGFSAAVAAAKSRLSKR